MYSTTVYIFQQKTRVLLIDTGAGYTFTYRWDPVYAKRLTINKGVDNVILFEFVNQDEKPVNITGSDFIFRVIDTSGQKMIIEQPMVILNAQFGRAKVTLSPEQLLEIEAQPANYSITRHSGNLTEAVFTDAQAGARAPIDIVNSVLPQFVPSSPLTIPTVELSSQVTYGGTSFQNWPNWAGQYWAGNASYYNSWLNTEYFSSFIEPTGAVTTVQMELDGYTGTIKAQAAQNYQSIWYNVTESKTFYNHTGIIHWNIVGWYPLVRMCFNNSLFATPNPPGIPAVAYALCNDGVLEQIIVQDGGSGYLAPPKIDIVGDGSGASAIAEIEPSTGTVTNIIVTNGGSGYWPIPVDGYNTLAYPVPPQNSGAFPIISTGFVTNLYYR